MQVCSVVVIIPTARARDYESVDGVGDAVWKDGRQKLLVANSPRYSDVQFIQIRKIIRSRVRISLIEIYRGPEQESETCVKISGY